MIIMGLILVFAGPWMLDILSQYTVGLFENMSTFVRE
jgi:flagellar biosynthesis protein FliQ